MVTPWEHSIRQATRTTHLNPGGLVSIGWTEVARGSEEGHRPQARPGPGRCAHLWLMRGSHEFAYGASVGRRVRSPDHPSLRGPRTSQHNGLPAGQRSPAHYRSTAFGIARNRRRPFWTLHEPPSLYTTREEHRRAQAHHRAQFAHDRIRRLESLAKGIEINNART